VISQGVCGSQSVTLAHLLEGVGQADSRYIGKEGIGCLLSVQNNQLSARQGEKQYNK
jgi:hypothetical protein